MPEPAAGSADASLQLRLRLRGELLEFLKFRVLAAQETFFHDLGDTAADAGPLRRWLRELGVRRFERLGDGDLLAVLACARRLYID